MGCSGVTIVREFARRIRIMMLRLGSILHAQVCYFISNFSESHLLEMSLVTWNGSYFLKR